jgi:DNA-directed RNA polymerase beta subunit
VKNLALLTHVTTDDEEVPVMRIAFNLGVEDIELMSGEELGHKGVYLVILNGRVLGVHRDATQFVRNFRMLRRAGKHHFVFQSPFGVSMRNHVMNVHVYVGCRPSVHLCINLRKRSS